MTELYKGTITDSDIDAAVWCFVNDLGWERIGDRIEINLNENDFVIDANNIYEVSSMVTATLNLHKFFPSYYNPILDYGKPLGTHIYFGSPMEVETGKRKRGTSFPVNRNDPLDNARKTIMAAASAVEKYLAEKKHNPEVEKKHKFEVKNIPGFIKCRETGSSYIVPWCSPGDYDLLVLGSRNVHFQRIDNYMSLCGFSYGGSYVLHGGSFFHSWKNSESIPIPLNIIYTWEEEFYNRFSLATELAKKYKLVKKKDRIELFHAILHGVDEYGITKGK